MVAQPAQDLQRVFADPPHALHKAVDRARQLLGYGLAPLHPTLVFLLHLGVPQLMLVFQIVERQQEQVVGKRREVALDGLGRFARGPCLLFRELVFGAPVGTDNRYTTALSCGFSSEALSCPYVLHILGIH